MHALHPVSSCLSTISFSDSFVLPNWILESYRNYIAACLMPRPIDRYATWFHPHECPSSYIIVVYDDLDSGQFCTDRLNIRKLLALSYNVHLMPRPIDRHVKRFLVPTHPSIWIVPPTLIGSLLHFWTEIGNCEKIRSHLSTSNAISYPRMPSFWVMLAAPFPGSGRDVGTFSSTLRQFQAYDVQVMSGIQACFQAFLGSFGTTCAGHVRDAGTFLGISGTQYPGHSQDTGKFLGISRQFKAQGVQATSKTWADFQAFLGILWHTVWRPCQGRIVAAVGT
ncbi:Hypothetical predicted protein [Olea europaea subsp. europaea]|uniref:Uncharacterized protein n=1 Tax=Olea europaea subsp. europaea TaxID=158383 RepID=A0A8S0QEJ2_OLEEU|nr:Hypothetical predicted protein [Olea europaea subsp. europaea]